MNANADFKHEILRFNENLIIKLKLIVLHWYWLTNVMYSVLVWPS